MADHVLSATLELKDKFSSKIKAVSKETKSFKNKIEKTENKLKKFENSGTSSMKKIANGTTINFKKVISAFEKYDKKTQVVIDKTDKFSKKFQEKIQKLDKKMRISSFMKWFGKGVKKAANTGITALNKYENKIKNVLGKTKDFSIKIGKNILKAGAVATGAGIYGIKAAGDFESLGARMNTVFAGDKEKAADYFKWANNFANVTPYSNEEVIDAAVKLKSYGYDPKRMMTMLGDWAAAYGKPLDQAVEAFADAGQGEYERLKELGINKNKVFEYAKKHGDEIKVSGERVLDPQKFMDTLQKMIIESSKDGMKNLANTLTGMFSTTAGLLKFNIAKLFGYDFDKNQVRAGSMLDRIKEKFEKFNTWAQSEEGQAKINKWVKAFDELLPSVGKIADAIKAKLEELAGENFVDKLTNSIKSFDPQKLNDGLKSIRENFDKTFKVAERLLGIMIGIELGKMFGPKGMIAGAIAGGFAPELIKTWRTLNDENSNAHKTIVDTASKHGTHSNFLMNFEAQETEMYRQLTEDFLIKRKVHEENKNLNNNFSFNISDINLTLNQGVTNNQELKKEIKVALAKEMDKKIDKAFENLAYNLSFGGDVV